MKNPEMGPGKPEESQENLDQNDEPKKVSRRGFLKAASGAVIGYSALGKVAESFAGDKKEETEDDPEVVKDKEFLMSFILEIAEKDGIGKSKRGGMIIYNGIGYYEIEKIGLDELVKSAKNERKEMEQRAKYLVVAKTEYEEKEARKVLDRAKQRITTFFVQKIEDVGHRLSVDDLPDNLKKFEKERIKKEKKE